MATQRIEQRRAANGDASQARALSDAHALRGSLRAELARKAIHLASATIPIAYAMGVPRTQVLLLLVALGVIAITVEIARLRAPRVRALFVHAFGMMLRERELGAWSGATWLVLAYIISAFAFKRDEAVAAMLAAGLGDASAAIVGRSVRAMRRVSPTVIPSKTHAGSVACLLVSFASALGIARLALVTSCVVACAATLAERWEPPHLLRHVDDNVRVALAAGVSAVVMRVLFAALP